MPTLTQTIVECRDIPRPARVRQGFPRLNDFARHVYRLRAARTARQASNPAPSDADMASAQRVKILASLKRIFEDDARLRLAARRAAVNGCWSGCRPLGREWTPPLKVVWTVPLGPIDQRDYQGLPASTPRVIGDRRGRIGRYRYRPSTRRIAVPAAWLLARLRERSTSQAKLSVVLHEADQAILTRQQQQRKQREMSLRAAQLDPEALDTLGWRIWYWDAKRQLLRSPDQGTLWHSAELRVQQ